VALDEADDHIGAAGPAALALVQHRVRLADARGRTEVDAEAAGRLDHVGGVLARRRDPAGVLAGARGNGDPRLLVDVGSLSSDQVASTV
jgi:hypothetical protein